MAKTILDPGNYPAVWNEHKRLSILHDRALASLMEAMQCNSPSELEEALLELRAAKEPSYQCLTLYSQFLRLERELERTEEVFALATRLRLSKDALDSDLKALEC